MDGVHRTLEVVVVPVADVDLAKAFYAQPDPLDNAWAVQQISARGR